MRRRELARALAVVALCLLGACGSDGGGPTTEADTAAGAEGAVTDGTADDGAVATNTVTLPRSYKFDPEVIRIATGSTVTWNNEDDFPHNVKVGDGETHDLSVGGSTTITFDEAGTFGYQCTLHPSQMKGTVIVGP